MQSSAQLKEAVARLRAQTALSESEVENRFQQAIDIGYWQGLSPAMALMDQQILAHLTSATLSSEQEAWALAHLGKHGYFRMPALVAPDIIVRMRASVKALHSKGWPAVFSCVYDEFWGILRIPPMIQFLSHQLGVGYLQAAAGVWTHRVDPRTRASGWAPHIDSTKDEGRITVWIPLTDVTATNGCMYVIPQDRVPSTLPTLFFEWTSISLKEVEALLHSVTPLPATAGSVLGWNHRLIHWGGRPTEPAAGSRFSLAADFLHERSTPGDDELPVFDAKMPAFPSRLRVIGQAILAYEKFEPLMHRYRGLATKLIEWSS
jgi:hypothetical protein